MARDPADRLRNVSIELSPGGTAVLGLDKPERNTNYADAYWELVDFVDQLAIGRGAWADRPGDADDGYLYYATDHEQFYRLEAGSWVSAGGTGTADQPLDELHVDTLSASGALEL